MAAMPKRLRRSARLLGQFFQHGAQWSRAGDALWKS
jgi:hypothetical protein